MCSDQIVTIFVLGVSVNFYMRTFVCVYNVMRELFEGVYLNTVVIITYFVRHVVLSLFY